MTIEVGHDVRRWTTLTVTDPSPQEARTLASGSDEALPLLRRLAATGRVAYMMHDEDEAAGVKEWLDPEANPDVVDVGEVEA